VRQKKQRNFRASLRYCSEAKVRRFLLLTYSLSALIIVEWVAAYSSPRYGIVGHAFILLLFLFHSYLERDLPEHKLLLSLTLAPALRLVSIAIPLASFYQLYRYIFATIPIVIVAVVIMRLLNLSPEEIGFRIRRKSFQVAVAVTGIPFGMIEYLILKPQRLVIGLKWADMILPGIAIIGSVGFVTEMVFRGVMQQVSDRVLGRWGIIYISLLSAILTMGRFSILSLLFMFGVSLFFAWVVRKTRSLLGVIFSRGIMNAELYLVLPAIYGFPREEMLC